MKVFLLSFTLFISAYLWATTFSSAGDKVAQITPAADTGYSSCVKDMEIYCGYNTNYSSNQCWNKAVNACNGKADAMRDISQAAKAKTLSDVNELTIQ